MASTALRFRRALSISSVLAARSTTTSSSIGIVHSSPVFRSPFSSPTTTNSLPKFSSRYLHSTSLSLYSSRPFNHADEIDENTILFEGCDYKHWLITMDFPKDPRPTPEEMVETYVQTLAKVVGSVEEAKKRMYACSTTTYHGFQAEIDEETSQKFEGMPGVVFILPDSYIDPVNKEYGGDKYINGTIIPRPPPVQYGRQRRQRYDQQRNSGYNREGPGQNFNQQQNFRQQNDGPRPNFASQQNYGLPQGHPQRGPMQNYPPQQNYAPPQQNFGPPRQGDRVDSMPSHNQGIGDPSRNQRDYGQNQNYAPPSFPGPQYGQGDRGSYGHNQGSGDPSRNQRGYGQNQNFAPPSSSGPQYGQGDRGSYGQNQESGDPSRNQRDYGHNQEFAPPSSAGAEYGQGDRGFYGQGPNSAYHQGYGAQGENRHLNQPHGEQNYPSMGQTRRD